MLNKKSLSIDLQHIKPAKTKDAISAKRKYLMASNLVKRANVFAESKCANINALEGPNV